MKPDYDRLYEFGENFALFAGALRVQAPNFETDDDALLEGRNRPRKAVRFERHSGTRLRDVIWTTSSTILISKRFRDVIRGLSGWSTYPVAVYDQTGQRIGDYFGLAITGRAGTVDDTRSKKVWRGPKYEGGLKFQRYRGMFFEADRWDGSDFFLPQGGYKIVTERAKEALEQADLDIKNVEFQRLSTIERDVNRQLEPRLRELS